MLAAQPHSQHAYIQVWQILTFSTCVVVLHLNEVFSVFLFSRRLILCFLDVQITFQMLVNLDFLE